MKKEQYENDSIKTIHEEYRIELTDFYLPFFAKKEELDRFVDLAFNYDETNDKVRFMIQQVQRLVSLAEDIDKIRPARDPLRIFFLKTCLDALCRIESDSRKYRITFFEEFENCFSEEAESYILDNFQYTGIDSPEITCLEEQLKYNEYEFREFTLKSFLLLIKAVRDMVAHEGDYWSIIFFSDGSDCPYCTDFCTKEDILGVGKQEKITYNFTANLDYHKFIFYFVEACISFIIKKGNLTF